MSSARDTDGTQSSGRSFSPEPVAPRYDYNALAQNLMIAKEFATNHSFCCEFYHIHILLECHALLLTKAQHLRAEFEMVGTDFLFSISQYVMPYFPKARALYDMFQVAFLLK